MAGGTFRKLLLGVTLYIAVATAMVGPMAFLGLIIANLSRQLLRTYRHTQLISGSVLFGMIIFIGGRLSASYDTLSEIAPVIYLPADTEIGMTTSGSFNLLGNDGRCSIIGVEIGFNNLTASDTGAAQTEKNPDYIFVMDRDRAIGTEGAQLAQEIMENELIMSTDAYKTGKIFI